MGDGIVIFFFELIEIAQRFNSAVVGDLGYGVSVFLGNGKIDFSQVMP